MLDARELAVRVEQERNGSQILVVRRVHFRAQNETTGIDEDVAFAANDSFPTVIAADAAGASWANGVAINDGRHSAQDSVQRTRSCSRTTALRRSQVPSMRQWRK
jgi:hypothetical protein